MEVVAFGSDRGLAELKSWNQTANALHGSCKRRRLNAHAPADSVQEEAWLDWLGRPYPSPETTNINQQPLAEPQHEIIPTVEENQEEKLDDAERDLLNNLMRYLLDLPEAVDNNQECGDSLGDTDKSFVSGLESQLNDIVQGIVREESTGVSSSKSGEERSLARAASSTELQIDNPQTPETNTEGRSMDEEHEETSDADSQEITILGAEGTRSAGAEENSWEELQISKGSHPASPSSSEETEILHCFSPQSEEEYNAVSLVHLLAACAEAAATCGGNKDLAAVILARIEHILSSTEKSPFIRVASYYHQSLQSVVKQELREENSTQSTETITVAFQLLHEVCPYIKFAHLTANEAILETVEGEAGVHIIDFDIMEGLQWPPLIAALATRSQDVPILRITAVQQLEQAANTLSPSLELTGRRLSECAEALHVPFSFAIATLEEETGSLKLDSSVDNGGETVVANCMLRLPHMTPRNFKSISAFMSAIAEQQIKLVTLATDEAFSYTSTDITERFFESLQHSCALFDSLEASLSVHSLARAMVESTFLVPRIWSTVSSICQQEEDELMGRSRSASYIMQDLGFQPKNTSRFNQTQARLLLAFYKEGFTIEEGEGHELAICWGDTRLVSVSAWEHMYVDKMPTPPCQGFI